MRKKIKLYIHAGFHKTGTTAIQNFFDLNSNTLLQMGILYPRDIRYYAPFIRERYAHHYLAWNLGFGNPERREEAKAAAAGFDFSLTLAEEIKSNNPHTVLLSSEVFNESVNAENLRRLWEFSKGIDVNFIFYVRRQDDVLISAYKHKVTIGNYTGSIEDFLKLGIRDYNVFLQQYLSKFDAEKIKIRVYEKGQLRKNLFMDILHVIGINSNRNFEFPNVNMSNVSLNDAYTEIMRKCNFSFDKKKKNKLKKVMLGVQTQPARAESSSLLSVEQRLEIINSFSSSYENIAKTFLNREDGKLFYEIPGEKDMEKKNDIQYNENLVRLIDELLA